MRIEPEVGEVAIVLLGNFNPAIFSPMWFAKRGVVSEEEAAEAQVQIISAEIASFKIGSKNLQIEKERFQIGSAEAPWITLQDFVAKTFLDYLVYTPISAFGINRQVHFKLPTSEARFKLGRRLAPIEPWGDWGQELEATESPRRSGLTDITMRQIRTEGDWTGYINATIQPSSVLSSAAGIFMRVNDHNAPIKPEQGEGAERIISFLIERFEPAIENAERIIDQIMRAGLEDK